MCIKIDRKYRIKKEDKMNYKDELNLTLHMVEEAKKVIMPHFQTQMHIEIKSDNSPVTIADKGAEEVIRKIIEKETPDYGIIGEEFGGQIGLSKREWVIDPIDGTKSFIHGVPLFGTLLTLLEESNPIVAVLALPALDQVMYAVKDGGCFLNEERCFVSRVKSIDKSLVLTTSSNDMEQYGYEESWKKLRGSVRLSRNWGDCYGYFLVASGRAEVMIDPVLCIWDIAPMPLIIGEAGGKCTSIKGESNTDKKNAIASNGIFHDQILEIFS